MRYIILALLLAFFFIGYSSAQNTDDFGMWMSAGTKKKINDRWNIGAGIELRTKDNSGSVDRWQLAINGVYKKTLNVTLASLISADEALTSLSPVFLMAALTFCVLPTYIGSFCIGRR